jgi:phosphoribosyl 1,2-cyclic phosphodiesterase
MRMKSIASGSSGNSIYVGTADTHILVDVGISRKKIENGLSELELCGDDLNAILITHEHSDHVSGLGVFLRKYCVPVYATQGTIDAIKRMSNLGEFDRSLLHVIGNDESFAIDDIEVSPVSISHDAADPVAYHFESNGVQTAILTDLGTYDDRIVKRMQGLSAIYLEANHDIRMLETGRYSYPLKQRILGKRGHLSNESSGRLLSELLNNDMKHIFLSHLSRENNLPELAYEAVRLEIELADNEYRGDDFPIDIARRDMPGMTLEL